MIGSRVADDDERWTNFLLMLDITDLLLAPEVLRMKSVHVHAKHLPWGRKQTRHLLKHEIQEREKN